MPESEKFKNKVEKVMSEYKNHTLEFSGEHKVKSRAQAVAIAMSEARKNAGK